MSQFNVQAARRSGGLDVYTGLLCVAALVLITGIVLMAGINTEHSAERSGAGGFITLVK